MRKRVPPALDWTAALAESGFLRVDELDFHVFRPAWFAHERHWILSAASAFVLEDPCSLALRARNRTLRPIYSARRVLSVDGARHL